ncbi:MAG: cupin domain-containing protein [Haloarculaceae archaeon]
MAYQKATTDDVASVVPEEWGGMWFLKKPLGTEHLGVSIFELEPDGRGREHDEADSGQEEVYVCVRGEATVELGEDTVVLHENEALRVDPGQRRQVFNRGDERFTLVVVGAPTSAAEPNPGE